jgi:DnaD/phage-associated family protein
LINDFGMEGYGFYWAIIEVLSEQKNYKLKKFKKLYSGLAQQLWTDENKIRSIIEAMLHDYELLVEDEDHIWSESLLRRMSIREAKRQAKVEAGRLGGIQSGISRGKKKTARSKSKQCLKQNEANEPKERKVKESTVKESTRTPPIVPPEAEEKKKPDDDGNGNPGLKKIYDAFSENIHPITPFEAESLGVWVDDGMEPDAIVWAIRQAVLQGKRTAKYIDAIIRNLHTENITTAAGAEARERNRADAKRQEPGRAREPTRLSPEEKERIAELNRQLAESMDINKAVEEVPPWEREPQRRTV